MTNRVDPGIKEKEVIATIESSKERHKLRVEQEKRRKNLQPGDENKT